jgi:hypothetical protein
MKRQRANEIVGEAAKFDSTRRARTASAVEHDAACAILDCSTNRR